MPFIAGVLSTLNLEEGWLLYVSAAAIVAGLILSSVIGYTVSLLSSQLTAHTVCSTQLTASHKFNITEVALIQFHIRWVVVFPEAGLTRAGC